MKSHLKRSKQTHAVAEGGRVKTRSFILLLLSSQPLPGPRCWRRWEKGCWDAVRKRYASIAHRRAGPVQNVMEDMSIAGGHFLLRWVSIGNRLTRWSGGVPANDEFGKHWDKFSQNCRNAWNYTSNLKPWEQGDPSVVLATVKPKVVPDIQKTLRTPSSHSCSAFHRFLDVRDHSYFAEWTSKVNWP